MELFNFTNDEIFKAVKIESSLFAKRQFNSTGDPLFNELVFDEEYSEIVPLFRSLFLDAQSEVLSVMPDSLLRDSNITFISENAPEDFNFVLEFKDGREKRYNFAFLKIVTVKIEEALIAYIMYRWLETKMPDYAKIYLSRHQNSLATARKNIRRTGIGQIQPFL